MYSYQLSAIGPLPSSWWTDRGLDPTVALFGGGLYAYLGDNKEPIQEFPIAVMDGYSWGRLNAWCNNLKTESLPNLADIETLFEEQTGGSLNWILDDGGARQEIDFTEPGEI